MSNGYNRLLNGSVGSSLQSPSILTFYTTCCQKEVSISHALRLARYRASGDTCCAKSYRQSSLLSPPTPTDRLNSSANGHNVTTNGGQVALLAATQRPFAREVRVELYMGHRGLHTSRSMSLDSKNGKDATATSRSLPKKPSTPPFPPQSSLPRKPPTSLLPPQSNLSKNLNLARRPSRMPGPFAGSKGQAPKVVGPSLALPNSPIQERLRDEEEIRRKAQARIDALRLAWLEKLHKAQAIASSVDSFLIWQKQEEKMLIRRRVVWRQKLRHAEKTADLIESFGWADTASVDRYLQLRSLVHRAQEVERQQVERHKQDGLNEQTRDISNAVWQGLKKDFADPDLAWIDQRLEEARPGRRRRTSLREAKRRPLRGSVNRLWLLRYAALHREMINTGQMISALFHDLRHVRRIRLQMQLSPETFSYHKFTFPLESIAAAASRLVTSVRNGWLELKIMAELWYRSSDPRLRRINDDRLILHHIGHLHWLTRSVVGDVKRRLSELSNSTLQRELFSTYRSLTTYTSHFPEFVDDLKDFLNYHPTTTMFKRTRTVSPRLSDVYEDIRVLGTVQRHILHHFELARLWTGISRLSSSNGQYSSEYNASTDLPSTDPRTPSIVHIIVPPGLHHAASNPPWLTPTPLYPLGLAIPILYIMTYDDLRRVLPRFHDPQRTKYLGFDTIRTTSEQDRRPVQFLILATEHEIAIVHVGIMSYQLILQLEPFRDVFRNPKILKVGVDVEPQRRVLLDELGIEAEGLIELHAAEKDDVLSPNDSFNDPRGQKISSMSAKTLGFPLPALNLDHAQKSIFERSKQPIIDADWSTDPLQYLTHLASRAYVVLQIYLATISDGSPTPAQSVQPSLGPVQVHRQSRDPGQSHVRLKYLKSMAHALASKTTFWSELQSQVDDFTRIQQTKRLTAYFLFTTFNESLETIRDYMGMPKVAAEILAVVHDAKLPLREDDASWLERLCRWHGLRVSLLETSSSPQAESPVNIRWLGREAGAISTKSRHTPWGPMGRTSAIYEKVPIAYIDVEKQPTRCADLSASTDPEPPSTRREQLVPDELLIQQLQSELRSVQWGSGLSKTERTKEKNRLEQRIRRAEGRRIRTRILEAMSRGSSLPLASSSTHTEQMLSSKMPSQRPLQEGTTSEHEDSPHTSETKASDLTDGANQSKSSHLRDTIVTLSHKIEMIRAQEGLTRQERKIEVTRWKERRRIATRQLEPEEPPVRKILAADDSFLIRKFRDRPGAAGIVEILAQEQRAQEMREPAVQAATTAAALKVLDVGNHDAKRESDVDDLLNAEQEVKAEQKVKEEPKAPNEAKNGGGDEPWWGSEL